MRAVEEHETFGITFDLVCRGWFFKAVPVRFKGTLLSQEISYKSDLMIRKRMIASPAINIQLIR